MLEYIDNIRKYIKASSFKNGCAYFIISFPLQSSISVRSYDYLVRPDLHLFDISEKNAIINIDLSYDIFRYFNYSNSIYSVTALNININDNDNAFMFYNDNEILRPGFIKWHRSGMFYGEVCTKFNPSWIFSDNKPLPFLHSSLESVYDTLTKYCPGYKMISPDSPMSIFSVKFVEEKYLSDIFKLKDQDENYNTYLSIADYIEINLIKTINYAYK